MAEKIKRKHDSRALTKLKIILLGYVFCIVISSFYVPLWLAPPFDNLTPFIYLALFLSWIPIIWKAQRRIQFDKWLVGLILLCTVASGSVITRSNVMSIGGCRFYGNNYEYLECNKDGWKASFHRITLGKLETNIFQYKTTYWFGPLF